MTASPPTAAAAPTDPVADRRPRAACCTRAAAAARADRQVAVLQELAEIGLGLARVLRGPEPAGDGAAEAADSEADARDGGRELAYSRLTRAIRLNMAMENQIAEARRVCEAMDLYHDGKAAEEQARRDAAAAKEVAAEQAQDKREIRHAVEKAIEAEVEPADVEPLKERLRETLADEDYLESLSDRPIGEVVAWICQQFGVPFDPELWVDEEWAKFEMTAKPKGSPYAGKDWPKPVPKPRLKAKPAGRGTGERSRGPP